MSRRVDLSARGCVCPGTSPGPSEFSAWNGNQAPNPRPLPITRRVECCPPDTDGILAPTGVERETGIEPATTCLEGRRSPHNTGLIASPLDSEFGVNRSEIRVDLSSAETATGDNW
jgi:hypothetical protein